MNIYICNILTYISQMILNIVEYNLHDNAFDAQRAKLNKKITSYYSNALE